MNNLSFEDGWTDVIIGGSPGRLAQQPKGWTISALPPGAALRSSGAFPNDDPPVKETVGTLPEVKCVPWYQLPENQQAGGSDALILDGQWVFKVFSNYSPYSFRAETVVETGAEPGQLVKLRVPVRTHFNPYNPNGGPMGDGSLGACRWRVAAGESVGIWHTYKIDVTDRQYFYQEITTVPAGTGGAVVLRVDLESASEAGIDYFVDKVTFEVQTPEPPEPGDTHPPRIPFRRVAFLLPPPKTLTIQELSNLMGRILPDALANGWEFGFSADAVALWSGGEPQDVIALSVHPTDWDRPALADFYARHYPWVTLSFKDFFTVPHFPIGTDQYPPVWWYVAQGFSLGQTGHPGIDINLDKSPWGDVERGFPVYAVYRGEVTYTAYNWYGVPMLVVKHTIGGVDYWCRYAHITLSSKTGDLVDSGQQLGDIADYPGGDHLHFEVHSKPVTTAYRTGNELEPVGWMKNALGLDPVLVDAMVRKGDSPTEPTPPPTPEPVYELRSRNEIALHSGFPAKYWDTYWEQSGANAMKVFSLGFAMEARRLVPDPRAVVLWRKFADDLAATDPPVKLLDRYSAEIKNHCDATGQTEAQVLAAVTAIESLNEQIPTFNADQIKRAVDFDVGFAQVLHQRYGTALLPALLTIAVGNPHETEYSLLLPAARAVAAVGGFLCYHGYWTANEQRSFITQYWDIHAGRWMRMDDVFRAAGVYPRWLLSEGGIVYANDGLNYDSGKGWRACGSFEKYLVDMNTHWGLVRDWNALHGNRCAALTVFCHGNNWPLFELGEGNVLLMNGQSPNWM